MTKWQIDDEGFKTRFIKLPDLIRDWTKDHLDLEASEVLDFGCGQGITALGMAMRNKARKVSAVDIMPDVKQCLEVAHAQLGLDNLPSNLALSQISPGQDFDSGRCFDLVYSWSVFEHVEQRLFDSVLAQLHGKLRLGGYLFIQIAPLFFSAEGSHLFHRIPIPWGHLTIQESAYYGMLHKACESKEETEALWSCYQWLNRVTGVDLKRRLVSSGFQLVREYVTHDPHAEYLPAGLLDIYQRDVLLTNQIVLLARTI